MTEAWGQEAEEAEVDDDSPVAAADDYPAAEGGAAIPHASAAAIAEDALDEEMRATQMQLEILEKLNLQITCLLWLHS